MAEIDDIQKAIYRLIDTSQAALIGAKDLDDKVEMSRLNRELLAMDRIFKLQRFRIEDSIKYAQLSERCDTCHSIVKKGDL